jgi:hypothetical protein
VFVQSYVCFLRLPHAFQLYLRLRCYGRCNRSRRVTDGHLQMIYLIYSYSTNQIIVNQQSKRQACYT